MKRPMSADACVCGYGDCPPCKNPSFCHHCRAVDATMKNVTRLTPLPPDWEDMSFEQLWDRLNRKREP